MDLMQTRTTRILAGLAAAPIAIALADLANPQWSWVEVMGSHFVNGRAGWLITIAGVAAATASASLIAPAAAYTRGHRAGLWLIGVWAVGMLIAGLVPADPPGQWDDPSAANLVHGLGGLAAFLALPAAALLLTRTWLRDERWRRAHRPLAVAAATTVVTLCAFAVAWVDVIDGPQLGVGPYPSVVGLLERVMIWSYAGWLAVVAVALHRMRPEEG
ncbi:DUF998 domain-containing protein [Phytohabitans kaempferiae]|uniref:DUF998 domain-containing protein n=1 Tax=Phytohabitans kaempferiae TaxID=1620943 RepID=A0ABV6MB14_9ACTN